jgi:hypothetical protein
MAENFLDKIGSIGAVIAGAAVPCCFPFLGLAGSMLGLGFLAPYATYVMYALQAAVILSLIGTLIAYNSHRKVAPLTLSIVCTSAMLYSLNTTPDPYILYLGLAGLLIVAVWNSIEARRCSDICDA